jgi:hypothetical protein
VLPTIRTFNVDSSTAHKIAEGEAAQEMSNAVVAESTTAPVTQVKPTTLRCEDLKPSRYAALRFLSDEVAKTEQALGSFLREA